MKHFYVFLLLTVLFCSCSTVRQVEPLSINEHELSLSAGGPLFANLGPPIPVPMVSLSYQYGLTDAVSVGGSVQLTPAVFGLFGFVELNSTLGIIKQWNLLPSLSASVNLHMMSNFESFFLFPEIALVPSWRLNQHILLYIGGGGMLNLYPQKAGGIEREYLFIPDFFTGVLLTFGQWDFSAELKLLQPFKDTTLGILLKVSVMIPISEGVVWVSKILPSLFGCVGMSSVPSSPTTSRSALTTVCAPPSTTPRLERELWTRRTVPY